MIEVKNLYKSFDGKEVLHDINAIFEDGKTNLIIGQSGSGKTVLVKNLVGLLSPDSVISRYKADALAEGYFARLRNEYLYLQHKFSLQPIDYHQWRFLRLRPQNFPYIRLAQLARPYFDRRASLSQIVECQTVKDLQKALDTQATPYWQTHFVFGAESARSEKRLSKASQRLLIINTVVPILFAYGRHKHDDRLCDRAFELLEELDAEQNHITRMWQECGLAVSNAGDSQALIQLKNEYCDRRDCLRCRIGYEYLKKGNHGSTGNS